jgi:C4-dicarboxylate-binding protein DctP
MVVTPAEFWNGLPDDIRTQLKQILDESLAYGNKMAGDKDIEDKQKIIDSKRTQIVTLTPEERAQWVEVMKPVWKKFEDEIGKDLIDAAYKANQTN